MTSERADVISRRAPANPDRMPVAFVPHGGGPWPFVEVGLGERSELDALAAYLRALPGLPPRKPAALLVVSAHWEAPAPTVMTSPRPPMLYDYYGFPPASYAITWPAPGEPRLAARVRTLLAGAGFETAEDSERGFDHGTFVPLKLAYPDADVPTVQLSLKAGLDPREHLAMGRALAPLRDEGVFIVGSGMTFHNLRAFRDPRSAPAAEAFDAWLREAATGAPAERDRRLADWARAPAARATHPREEHLLPLMVVAGAAGDDRGTIPYNGTYAGLRISAYHFG
jgi:aromatic ring-opening dioxygenase catalytic subunit (LigB family)